MTDGFLSAVVRRDLRARLREKWGIVLWIAIPLVLGGMLGALFTGRDGPTPVAELLVIDQDQTLVSGLLVSAFSQGQLAQMVNVQPLSDRVAARAIMDQGEASAMLVIPRGFSETILAEEPGRLELVTNPSQRILPGIIEETLALVVEGVFYLQRLFGTELAQLRDLVEGGGATGPSDAGVAAMSIAINQAMAGLDDYLFPPRITVELIAPDNQEAEEGPSYLVLLFPGLVLMTLMFAAQSLASDLWEERRAGTLRRLAVTPRSLTHLTVGKAAAVAALMGLVGGSVMTLGFALLDLPWLRWPLALIWQTLGGVSLYALMSVVSLHSPSQRAANILTSILLFPMLILGGSFFPLESMPRGLAAVGAWTPNGIVLTQLKNHLLARSDLTDLALAMLALAAVTAALLAVCRWRLAAFARGA